mmetsp:Transcript_34697/g.62486  ORF Transcript_34697/g.62486 Transcript_34697/m.62486 type:complete len:315 (-) Transcript_34697:795-1739(-)
MLSSGITLRVGGPTKSSPSSSRVVKRVIVSCLSWVDCPEASCSSWKSLKRRSSSANLCAAFKTSPSVRKPDLSLSMPSNWRLISSLLNQVMPACDRAAVKSLIDSWPSLRLLALVSSGLASSASGSAGFKNSRVRSLPWRAACRAWSACSPSTPKTLLARAFALLVASSCFAVAERRMAGPEAAGVVSVAVGVAGSPTAEDDLANIFKTLARTSPASSSAAAAFRCFPYLLATSFSFDAGPSASSGSARQFWDSSNKKNKGTCWKMARISRCTSSSWCSRFLRFSPVGGGYVCSCAWTCIWRLAFSSKTSVTSA